MDQDLVGAAREDQAAEQVQVGQAAQVAEACGKLARLLVAEVQEEAAQALDLPVAAPDPVAVELAAGRDLRPKAPGVQVLVQDQAEVEQGARALAHLRNQENG